MGIFDMFKKKRMPHVSAPLGTLDKPEPASETTPFPDPAAAFPKPAAPMSPPAPELPKPAFPKTFDEPAPQHAPMPVTPPGSFGEEKPPSGSRDFELINAKLDAIKARVDQINQRVANLERQKQKETLRW